MWKRKVCLQRTVEQLEDLSGTGSKQAATSVKSLMLNLTVYHVNPAHEGSMPINMDTADLRGDMMFDLQSKTLPLECVSEFADPADCSNGENIDADLVVSKMQLMLQRPSFGTYAKCNICLPSGVDPLSHLPCEPEKYFCTCNHHDDPWGHPYICNNETAVGMEEIEKQFNNGTWDCTWDKWARAPWLCWGWPIVAKVLAHPPLVGTPLLRALIRVCCHTL